MEPDNAQRLAVAKGIAEAAAQSALALFNDNPGLHIEVKGAQDWVSNADKSVENEIRDALATAFPNDGVIGEEHGRVQGSSGLTWVIDPIDGTSNFVNAMPGWCVVLCCVSEEATQLGVIVDPIAGETFWALKGQGAFCNGKQLRVSKAQSVSEGSVAVGHSSRIDASITLNTINKLLSAGGLFYRNGSGALMLVYVASGRLLAHIEPHMFAWDCLAAILMVREAGGEVAPYNHKAMLTTGSDVLASAPGIYETVKALS